MAVITPGSIAGLYGATSRRTPYQGRRVIPTGEETEAQRLARESNEQMNEAARKDRMALGITSAVLSGTNMLLQAGLKGWELGRNPAAVRSQVAQAEMLGEQAEEIGSRVNMDPLTSPAAQPTPKSNPIYESFERTMSGIPVSAQQPQPPAREPIQMSTGDLQQLLSALPNIQAYANNPTQRKQLLKSLGERGLEASAAEEMVSSMLGQGQFIAQNHEALVASGALILTEGEPTGYWQAVGSQPTTSWRGPKALSEEMSASAPPEYLAKLATVREKTGDEALLAKVVERVVADPSAGPALLEEAKASAPAFDWDALAAAAASGNTTPIIEAYLKAITMTPDQAKAETAVGGLKSAMALFGEEGEPRIPLTTSIHDIQSAVTALRSSGRDDLAAKLMDEQVWARTEDWRSVVPSGMAARPGDAVQDFLNKGKSDSGMSPSQKAKAMFAMAKDVRGMKRLEYDAQTKRLKAGKPRSKASYRKSVDFARSSGDIEQLRESPEYLLLVEHDGNNIRAEKLAKKVMRGKTSADINSLKTASDLILKERLKAADADADAAAAAAKAKKDKLTGRRPFLKDLNAAEEKLRQYENQWGVDSGGTLSAESFVSSSLSQAKAKRPNMRKTAEGTLRDNLKARSAAGSRKVNARLVKLRKAVEDAKSALKSFDEL